MRTARLLPLLGAIALAAWAPLAARIPVSNPNYWRIIITLNDKWRLRTWRDGWMTGLTQARADGFGPAIEKEGALLDPDSAQEGPDIPDGDYRCRVFKIGRKTATGSANVTDPVERRLLDNITASGNGPTYVIDPAGTCRIANGRFIRLDGQQRPAGRLWPLDATRILFLGALALGDEPRALDYGRDTDRDMIGTIERIGERRWRMVLPRPHWESQVDVMELTPKDG